MRLKGIQSGREGEKLGMEKEKLELEKRDQENKNMLAGAQTSMYNSEVLRNNVLSQGASLEQHIKTKQFFAPEKATFESMGLDPVLKNISESEMHNVWSKRPDSGGLTWLVTDVKLGVDGKGMPTYEYIYSGYDLKKDLPLTEQTLKLWKESGLDKTHPEIFQYKPGSTIPANNWKAWNQQALGDLNQKIELEKSSTDIAVKQQQIKESQARAARDWAESVKQNKDLRKEEHIENAMNDLANSGYDISKVKPENRAIVGQYAGQMLRDLGPSFTASTKIGESTGDWSQAQIIAKQMEGFQNLISGTIKGKIDTKGLPHPEASKDSSIRGAAGLAALPFYLKAANGDMDAARDAMLEAGWTLAAAQAVAGPAGPETVGGAIKSGVKSAAGTVIKYHPIAVGKRILEMPASDITSPEKIKEAIVK